MHSHSSPFLLAALFAASAASQDNSQPRRDLIEVVVQTPAEMQRFLALDLDIAGLRASSPTAKHFDVIGFPGDLARLQQANLHGTRLVADMAAAHAAALAQVPTIGGDTLTPAIGQGAMGGHYTLAEMVTILDDFHNQYPQLCSQRISIGQSIEGRELWMVKISDNVLVDENEPEVLYDALHHAREPLSLGATLLFMDELLDGYGVDPEATYLINERELYFIPCVNPDGYEFNRISNPGGGGLWRKNRRDNGGGVFGVDLNRNYATGWSAPNGGSSTNTTSQTYRGTAAFSEPEAAAVEAFTLTRQFVQVFSTHSYTDVLLRPFGWQTSAPANAAAYDLMGDYLVADSNIAHGSVTQILYVASGGSIDHHHTAHGSYGWTAELGRADEGGFWPVGADIEAIARRHQSMFRKAALLAGSAFVQVAATVTEASGGNGNQIIEPGETAEVVITVQNVGAAAASLVIELIANDPQLVVGNNLVAVGAVPAVTSASNAATPLTFSVPASFVGMVTELTVRVSGDGRSQDSVLQVALVASRTCIDDDFEQDRGFARAVGGTATTGLWERSMPQATTSSSVVIQPGNQTTPAGSMCWVTDGAAGASAGANDVDGGFTELWSPTMDLSHLSLATVVLQHWYAESGSNDALLISISRDGGTNWQALHTTSSSTGSWQQLELPLGAPLTNQMVLRVRAQDLNPSLVEACIDDLQIVALAEHGATTLLGSGSLGSNLRIGGNGPVGGLLLPIASLGLATPVSVPGIGGLLLLDTATATTFPFAVLGSSGYYAYDLALPVQAGLIGLPLAFQSVVLANGSITFGANAASVTLQ